MSGAGSSQPHDKRAFGHVALELTQRLWASPNTLLGLLIASLCWIGGVRWQWCEGALECYGPGVAGFFRRFVPGRSVAAMTLGDVILGVSAEVLAEVRSHEQVHVRQYRRWGPFFLPAYVSCSCWIWWRGGDVYRDNQFEVEAFREAQP